MTHRLRKELFGQSVETSGVILDEPSSDPGDIFVHHVMCVGGQLYYLPRDVVQRSMQMLDRKRPNDILRREEERLSFGQNIQFKYEVKNMTYRIVQDYYRGGDHVKFEIRNGVKLFRCSAVFNPDLNLAHTSMFGTLPVDNIAGLGFLPTPDIEVTALVSFTLDKPNGKINFKLHQVTDEFHHKLDDSDLCTQAPWNEGQICFDMGDDEDEFGVAVEHTAAKTYNMKESQLGIVTGLNTIYVPDLPRETVLLPFYRPSPQHHIGCKVRCDLIWNDVCKAYVVYSRVMDKAVAYDTNIVKSPTYGVYAHFETLLRVNPEDYTWGFFEHPFFGYIADPQGLLDLQAFKVMLKAVNNRAVYRVQIFDKYGMENPLCNVRSERLVTRLEVVRVVESDELVRQVAKVRASTITLQAEVEGVVLNAATRRVFVKTIPMADFYLADDSSVRVCELLKITLAKRDTDALTSSLRPIFRILKATKNGMSRDVRNEIYEDRLYFTFPAVFDKRTQCFKSDEFGFVPPDDVLDRFKGAHLTNTNKFRIRAVENVDHLPQTVMHSGMPLETDVY